MTPIVERFCDFYRELNAESLASLDLIYDNDAIFVDPLHSIEGLGAITRYFELMMGNLSFCTFEIVDVLENQNQAFVTWIMTFSHARLNQGKKICVYGNSHIKFGLKVKYHRDYYDVGQMLYEQIPVLGYVIGKLKNRVKP